MNFLTKTKKQEEILLFDFGRGSVKGIIFNAGEKNKILNFQSEKIEQFGIFDGKNYEMDVIKKATNKLVEKLGGETKISEISKIMLGFSPDILKAEIFNVSIEREPWKANIVKEEQEEIYKSVLDKAEKIFFEKASGDVKIFKKKIIGKKISGYEAPCLVGLNGEKLDFKVLIVYSSENYTEFIRTAKKDLRLERAEIFHSVEALNNLAMTDAQIFDKGNYKIFLNMGEKNTLITLFKENFNFVADFQIGGYDFTKAIANELGLREDEAEIIKQNFSEGKLKSQVNERIKKIILPVLSHWQENFAQCIKNKMGPFEVVVESYLFGGGSLLSLIGEMVLEKLKIKKCDFFLPDNLPLENKTKIIFSAKDTPSLLLTFCSSLLSDKNRGD
jgi:cell division ATPase FtsA